MKSLPWAEALSLKGNRADRIADINTLKQKPKIVKWTEPGSVSCPAGLRSRVLGHKVISVSGLSLCPGKGGKGRKSELGESSLQEAAGLEVAQTRGVLGCRTSPVGLEDQSPRQHLDGSRPMCLEPERRPEVMAVAGFAPCLPDTV